MKLDPKQTMIYVLKDMKVDFVQEFKFHPTRRWRADFAIPDKKILIEYEGLMSAKSRHTTITGFSNDSTKYNNAVMLGYKVLRYTALTIGNMREELTQIL